MNENSFVLSIWKSNEKYEFRVPKQSRDKYFDINVQNINLILPDMKPVTLKIRPSFWNKCSHFGNAKTNEWLRNNKYIPYPKGNPPKFNLQRTNETTYKLDI